MIRESATGSFVAEDIHYEYRKERNRKEALAWCAALDALLATRGITGEHVVVEIAVRRLHAVREADRTNSWSVAEALDIWAPGFTLGTIDQRRRLRRDVRGMRSETAPPRSTRRTARRPSAASPGSGASRGGAAVAAAAGNSVRGGSGRGAGGPPRRW